MFDPFTASSAISLIASAARSHAEAHARVARFEAEAAHKLRLRESHSADLRMLCEQAREAFRETLALFAADARQKLAEKDRYGAAEIAAAHDAALATRYRARLEDLDCELRRIRADALALFKQFNRLIAFLGGQLPAPDVSVSCVLELSANEVRS